MPLPRCGGHGQEAARPDVQPETSLSAQLPPSPATLPGATQASSPQCGLHAQQVPVNELGLQVMVQRVIPLLEGHPRPGLVAAQIWGHKEGRVAGRPRESLHPTSWQRTWGHCGLQRDRNGLRGPRRATSHLCRVQPPSPEMHNGRARGPHRRQPGGLDSFPGGCWPGRKGEAWDRKAMGTEAGMSWHYDLGRGTAPTPRSLRFLLHRIGYRTLPPSALGSAPSQ